MKTKLLFVCTRNQWRSPTAEALFKDHPALRCVKRVLVTGQQEIDLAWFRTYQLFILFSIL